MATDADIRAMIETRYVGRRITPNLVLEMNEHLERSGHTQRVSHIRDRADGYPEIVLVSSPSTEVTHYVDKAMFESESIDEGALEKPKVYLLSATPDPLGAAAAMAMMYEGRTVRSLSEISDDERKHYFDDCFNTALKTPFEMIDFHFMVEGLTRASWDQMRTQRTASFAGESLRFAVKEDLANSVRPGPLVLNDKKKKVIWDNAIEDISNAYHALIGAGAPAEDARGLLPLNTLVRGHWKTNLRNLETEIGKRLCTQAQWEWRMIHADLRRAINEYKGPATSWWDYDNSLRYENAWQFEYIANHAKLFVPICFQKGACMFKAKADRGCTIRERVDRGAFEEIQPTEWLLDPTAAWVK